MNTALAIPKTYVARRNFFNFLGISCRILDDQGGLLFFVKLKAFKLKEDITVYRDKAKTQPYLKIKARNIIDFAGTYDVIDLERNQNIGILRRKGWKSLFRDQWEILDANEMPIGLMKEDSALMAFLRRFLSNLIPQNYHIFVNDQVVGVVMGTWNPFLVKYKVNFNIDQNQLLDPRMGLALQVVLMTIEGKQG